VDLEGVVAAWDNLVSVLEGEFYDVKGDDRAEGTVVIIRDHREWSAVIDCFVDGSFVAQDKIPPLKQRFGWGVVWMVAPKERTRETLLLHPNRIIFSNTPCKVNLRMIQLYKYLNLPHENRSSKK
jgi:hypothetical protein